MIAVDANGADQGPGAVAEGVRRSGLPVLLFGPRLELLSAGERAELVDAPETIKAGDEPVAAVRSRRRPRSCRPPPPWATGAPTRSSPPARTGPTLAAGTVSIKRIRGVFRPALAVLLPVPGGPVLLLDAGASVQARPEHLVQFAYMGACFMEACVGDRAAAGRAAVGGRGVGQGHPGDAGRARAARRGQRSNFAGNVEGFDLPRASVDVVVADGFAGNVALKVLEATVKSLTGAIGDAHPLRARLEPRRPADPRRGCGGLRDELDPEGVGGAILLGLRKPVVVAHGSFGPRGIESAVRLAHRAVEEDMVGAHRRGARCRRGVAVRARW